MNIYELSYKELYSWVEKNHFKGYDPYDGLNNNFFSFKERNRIISLFWMHLIKTSPVNVRSLFNIKKSIDKQGLGLIIQSLLKYGITDKENDIHNMIKYLKDKSLKKKYGHHCWNGHEFIVPDYNIYQTPDIPGIIGTDACASAFFEYYKKYKKYKDVILDVKEFILKYLLINDKITYLKYKPISSVNSITFNASAVGFSYLLKTTEIEKDNYVKKLAKNFYDYLVSKQNPKGYWEYKINLKTGKTRTQIDFHQGFILNGIYNFIKYTRPQNQKYMNSLLKGLKFYKSEQFNSDGISKWRYPRKFPIDIHNQSQGIITFCELSDVDSENLDFAEIILNWTIRNMQDKKGYFYYQKWPIFINKIPYIRWSQSWMMLSLATYLNKIKKDTMEN